MAETGRIFISYRRGDSAYVAGRLFDRLVDRYGADRVFMDVEGIPLGADFADVIDNGVADAAALIAVIGKDWLTCADADGRRRLDDPDDWVVVEIAAALERGIPVAPVLVDGVDMPRRQDLPTRLAALARRNALRLGRDTFRVDVADLVEMLDGVLRGAVGPARRRRLSTRPILRFVHPRPATLAGRDTLLSTMRTCLTEPGPMPRSIVLHGLGGVGKTSAMLEYAHRYLDFYDLVAEVSVADEAATSAGFADLATLLGVRDAGNGADPVAEVHGALAVRGGPWLLLLDNAPDGGTVRRLAPPIGHGHVIATSRSAAFRPAEGLLVPVLEHAAAAAFLMEQIDCDGDSATATALADELGCLPLALAQAGAYIVAAGMTLERYLHLLRARQTDLLRRGELAEYRESVATTWNLAINRLASETPGAVALLRLLACFAPDGIPYEQLLASAAEITDPGRHLAPLRDELVLLDAVAGLQRYSLVGPPRDGLVSVHRLVQAVTMGALLADDRLAWRAVAGELVTTALPADPEEPGSWPVWAVLFPHARAVLSPSVPGVDRVARYLVASGDYSSAAIVCEDAFRDVRDRLGPEHPDTLAKQVRWANATGRTGHPSAARDVIAEVLPVVERVCGSDGLLTVTARAEYLDWVGQSGDPVRARDLAAALLPDARRVLGLEHRVTLQLWLDLAFWTGQAGDAAAARDIYAEFIPLRERVFGSGHAEVLHSLGQYARWIGEAGDPAGALELCVNLVDRYEAALGREHPDTLWAHANLAWFTGEAGDPAGARDRYAEVVATCQRASGPTSHLTLVARGNHAYWTGIAGDPARARDLCAALLPIRSRAFGAEHHDTLVLRLNLARWTGEAGQPATARDLCASLIDAFGRRLGPYHPHTAEAGAEFTRWNAQATAESRSGSRLQTTDDVCHAPGEPTDGSSSKRAAIQSQGQDARNPSV